MYNQLTSILVLEAERNLVLLSASQHYYRRSVWFETACFCVTADCEKQMATIGTLHHATKTGGVRDVG